MGEADIGDEAIRQSQKSVLGSESRMAMQAHIQTGSTETHNCTEIGIETQTHWARNWENNIHRTRRDEKQALREKQGNKECSVTQHLF